MNWTDYNISNFDTKSGTDYCYVSENIPIKPVIIGRLIGFNPTQMPLNVNRLYHRLDLNISSACTCLLKEINPFLRRPHILEKANNRLKALFKYIGISSAFKTSYKFRPSR